MDGWGSGDGQGSPGRGKEAVKVTLFITELLEKYFSECQNVSPLSVRSPSLPLVQLLYLSISPSLFADGALSGFLMRCQHLRWNGGGAKEKERERARERCKKNKKKKPGVQSREILHECVFCERLQSFTAAGGSSQREELRESVAQHTGFKLSLHLQSSVGKRCPKVLV